MATSTFSENYISKANDDPDRIDWEPFTLTLVEYPKGKHKKDTSIDNYFYLAYLYLYLYTIPSHQQKVYGPIVRMHV